VAAVEHRGRAHLRGHRLPFEVLLDNIVVLALFIPIVLALAESVSMQSATLTLQTLSDDSLKPRRIAGGAVEGGADGRAARGGVRRGGGAGRHRVAAETSLGPRSSAGAIAASIVTACLFGVLWPTLHSRAQGRPAHSRRAAGAGQHRCGDAAVLPGSRRDAVRVGDRVGSREGVGVANTERRGCTERRDFSPGVAPRAQGVAPRIQGTRASTPPRRSPATPAAPAHPARGRQSARVAGA
jgi:hypothetical protein